MICKNEKTELQEGIKRGKGIKVALKKKNNFNLSYERGKKVIYNEKNDSLYITFSTLKKNWFYLFQWIILTNRACQLTVFDFR